MTDQQKFERIAETVLAQHKDHPIKALSDFSAQSIREKDKLLKAIRHATYARDTDDEILDEIKKLLTKGGYPYEAED